MSRPPLPRQKMSAKKKWSAIIALFLTLALAMGGAFAWTDFSQFFINRFRGGASPDALLHDDFTPNVNKDVYVENPGTQPIIVRIMFKEFFQVGNDITKDANEKTPNSNDQDTWPTVLLDANGPTNSIASTYYKWTMSGLQKVYLPGTSAWGDEDYSGKAVNTEDVTGPNGQMFQNTLDSSTILTMKEWIDLGEVERANSPARWIVDTDGWAYWSKLLLPNTATNLLLDKVTPIENAVPEDNYFYAIDVKMEVTNKTDVAKFSGRKDTDPYPNASESAKTYILNLLSNSETPVTPPNSPFSIDLLDGDENMDPGEGEEFTLSGTTIPDEVTWSVVDENGTMNDNLDIDQNGYLTVKTGYTGTKAKVTATDVNDNSKFATYTMNVEDTALDSASVQVAFLTDEPIELFLGETEVDMKDYVKYIYTKAGEETKKPSKYVDWGVVWSVEPANPAEDPRFTGTQFVTDGILAISPSLDLYNGDGTLWAGMTVKASLNGDKTTNVKYGTGKDFYMDGTTDDTKWRAIKKTVVDGKAYYLAVKSAVLTKAQIDPNNMDSDVTVNGTVLFGNSSPYSGSKVKSVIDNWFDGLNPDTSEVRKNAVAHNALSTTGSWDGTNLIDNRTDFGRAASWSGFSAPLTSGDATAFALSAQEISRYVCARYTNLHQLEVRHNNDPVYTNWKKLTDSDTTSWGRTTIDDATNAAVINDFGTAQTKPVSENHNIRPALWVKAEIVEKTQ